MGRGTGRKDQGNNQERHPHVIPIPSNSSMKSRTPITPDKGSTIPLLTSNSILYSTFSLDGTLPPCLSKSTLRKGHKKHTKRKLKILRAIRKRGQETRTPHTITNKILKQHTTRFQTPESSTVIPPSPPPVHEETLTIRLIFPGRELPNQYFVTPITHTIRQLTQRITALFVSPSLITNTLLYVRTSGPTWTKFHRPGPISNRFLP